MPRAAPAERARDLLIAVLGLTTGAVDATAFERLGHVFASVITGNLILLGIGAEQTDGRLALLSGCSIAAYALGVILAGRPGRPGRHAPAGGRDESLWPRGVTTALVLDLNLLVAFAVVWEAGGAQPDDALKLVLLALIAAAMGAQSSAVRRLGNFSSTYLTGTLTGMLEELVAHRWSPSTRRSAAVIAAVVAGAAAAILLVSKAWAALPILPIVPLGVVIVTAWLRLDG